MVNSKETNISLDEKVKQLSNYYSDKGLLLVGLNDSQGVNTTSFFKKGLLEYLAWALQSDQLRPYVINAFSLMMSNYSHPMNCLFISK